MGNESTANKIMGKRRRLILSENAPTMGQPTIVPKNKTEITYDACNAVN